MMKGIKKEQKQSSSIHQKIRNATFVHTELEESERFKYFQASRLSSKFKEIHISLKRRVNSIVQKPLLWASFVDWKTVREDLIEWSVESLLEGFTANFVTHYLFGWTFNLFTMLAYGFAIKQGLSIHRRLKQDGTVSKIPKKND